MNELQNPMTGFKLLEQAFSEGFRMRQISGSKDVYIEIDQGLIGMRYTYARLEGLKVQQLAVLDQVQPLNGLPCFSLFYGTLEELRGKGLTPPFIEYVLKQFAKDLHANYGNQYYIESLIETNNEASLTIAKKIFGEPSNDGVDEESGIPTRIWQFKESR